MLQMLSLLTSPADHLTRMFPIHQEIISSQCLPENRSRYKLDFTDRQLKGHSIGEYIREEEEKWGHPRENTNCTEK